MFRLLLILLFATTINTALAKGFTQYDIAQVGWSVTYLGCSYDSQQDAATYSYSMNVQDWEKDLSHWVLGLNDDVFPVSTTGGSLIEYNLDPTTGVYGVKWDDGQAKGTDQSYSVTFAGVCDESTTNYSVKGGTYYAIGSTTGPGFSGVSDNTYSVSGTLWLDVNQDGIFQQDEPIFSNTTVQLYDDASNLLGYLVTDNTGAFNFQGLSNGNYEVHIADTTALSSDFNESLYQYFTYDTDSVYVTVDQNDVTDVDFGYGINITAINDDINNDDLDGDGFTFTGNGKTIGFWKHQHSVALKGKGRAHIDEATLLAYLTNIEAFWLATPFQFDDNKLSNSFAVLKNTTSVPFELLNKQLLATELNTFHGIGLSNNLQLQTIIIQMAETVSFNHVNYDSSYILQVKDLLDNINNSGH